ncbi:MAG: DUF2147 domain-containing protein [Xanthobacteraceae bacterium]
MRATSLVAFAVLLSLTAGGHAAATSAAATSAAATSPIGLWQANDPESGKPTGWFAITEHDGVFDGTLVKMFLKPSEDPNIVCRQCRGDRHDQRWLGLQIIRGMRRDGAEKYDGGTILDPRDGNVYDAMMKVSDDGQTLIVRGFLGISFLGRNQYWTRLPDSDYAELDPSVKAQLDSPTRSDPASDPPSH